jgi:putative ABC transport system ATP-binding protein
MRQADPIFTQNQTTSLEISPCPGEPLIEMMDIFKTFKSAAGEFTALKGVNACFYPGEFVSVVGKSGSGKSTLVNMLTGIDHPTSGMVRVGQTRIHQLSESRMSLWRGRNLGIVFQFFQLLPMLSLIENVVLPMDLCEMYSPAEREGRALELLRMFDLEEYAHALPDAVSGGQQQSAAIARALANDPPIIIADEPTGNLDSRTADGVFEMFKNLVRQGKTIIMVTHDSSLASQTDRLMILSDGELIGEHVARALSSFPHKRLLWIEHHLHCHHLAPGEALTAQGAFPYGLLLVASGSLEVSVDRSWDSYTLRPTSDSIGSDKRQNRGAEAAPVILPAGELLTVCDFKQMGDAITGLHAAQDGGAQVLALSVADFEQWLKEFPIDQEKLLARARQLQEKWRQAEPQAAAEDRA